MNGGPGTVVVVGASLAGHATARALRGAGFDGTIRMIGEEPHRPYDRPPLSKGYLRGTVTDADLSLEGVDEDLGADWILGTRATALDPATHTVSLADGTHVRGDAVVVATGSLARRLPTDLMGVHTLRTLDDARALRADLLPGARVCVVGAGFVGAEVASTAAALGLDVTVVEAAPAPLAGPLGPLGPVVASLHARNGVTLRCGVPVERLEGAATGSGRRVTGVRLVDGSRVDADVVGVGIGAPAATDWLAGSGLDLQNGLACDARGATAAPGVVGVGDCSAWFDPVRGRHHRVEHWAESRDRARIAVDTLLGTSTAPPAPAPSFWSDQYGVRLQFAGRLLGHETVTVEAGDPESADALVVYWRGDDAVAVLGMGQPRLFNRWKRSLSALPVAA